MSANSIAIVAHALAMLDMQGNMRQVTTPQIKAPKSEIDGQVFLYRAEQKRQRKAQKRQTHDT